jgi:hypothetical protein
MWPFPPKPDPILATLNILIDQNQQSQREMMKAVQAITDAAGKQAEVLGKYLDLFKTTDEPRRWTEDPEQESKQQLLDAGFPNGGTEAEQAQWVLDNLDKL